MAVHNHDEYENENDSCVSFNLNTLVVFESLLLAGSIAVGMIGLTFKIEAE